MRQRKFSLWRPVRLEDFTTKSAPQSQQNDPCETFIGRVRKRTSGILSPWTAAWHIDPSSIDVISAPRSNPRAWAGSRAVNIGGEIDRRYGSQRKWKDAAFLAVLILPPLILLGVLLWVVFG